MPQFFFVTNKNDEDYESRFDGVDYQFPSNKKSKAIPEAALKLFFALGGNNDDRKRCKNRAGKIAKYYEDSTGQQQVRYDIEGAESWLKNFTIKPGKFVEDEGISTESPKVVTQDLDEAAKEEKKEKKKDKFS